MQNYKNAFLKIHFLQNDRQEFLKDVEIHLIEKRLDFNPTKREIYWMRTLRILYLGGHNIDSDFIFTNIHDSQDSSVKYRLFR